MRTTQLVQHGQHDVYSTVCYKKMARTWLAQNPNPSQQRQQVASEEYDLQRAKMRQVGRKKGKDQEQSNFRLQAVVQLAYEASVLSSWLMCYSKSSFMVFLKLSLTKHTNKTENSKTSRS